MTRIAQATGIPAAHLEKDFWVTEVLRGAAAASRSTGCSVIFKGGTSLSKAHRLIERFSEDVDLIVVLPEGGAGAGDTKLKAFVKAAEETTGVASATDFATVTKGVKRTATFAYPRSHVVGLLKPGVLMELGTRGGALPHRRLPIQSLIAEYAEELVLLHHAATQGDDQRRAATARHYYDVDQLLRNDRVVSDLKVLGIDILAREIALHSRAAGLPTADRPRNGFATSLAWTAPDSVTTDAYNRVPMELIWPTAKASTIEQCCERVAALL